MFFESIKIKATNHQKTNSFPHIHETSSPHHAPFLFAGFTANALGTKEDYKRAYSLESKFGEHNVRHWAHRIAWKDSTHVLL